MNKNAGDNYLFEKALIVSVAIVILAAGYESYTQKFQPGLSILSLLHSYGYMKGYPVIYQPGKGIWRLMAWTGSGMMVVMMLYSVRKRVTLFHSIGSLRHWLSAHMFLGIMGPILVTFHTTFKFGGLIATSYWCMVLTMIFGILGRYIYVQIPRTLAGTELEASDIDKLIESIDAKLGKFSTGVNVAGVRNLLESPDVQLEDQNPLKALIVMFRADFMNSFKIINLNSLLKRNYHLPRKTRIDIVELIKKRAALIRKKSYLSASHKLLHYWHVIHVPLAIVMFFIMFIHIVVYYLFRPDTAVVM